MLSFSHVDYSYPDAASPALADVSLDILPGRYVVLLGANGSGKTTLARLANGLLLPDSGQVCVEGLNTATPETLRALRQSVGLVSQDPDEQIVSTTVIDEVAFGPENLGLQQSEIMARVEQSLTAVNLSDFAERDPNTLSGGQKQRLVLAGILAMQPQYLVLDEPTSMLDQSAQHDFIATISELCREGHGVLHITHDLKIAAAADSVVVLADGHLVFNGSPSELLARETDLVNWKLKFPVDKPAVSPSRCTISTPVSNSSHTTLQLRDVHFSYPSFSDRPITVLKGITLSLEAGSYTLISGISGAGKSTLLRLAAGLLKPGQGEIGFFSEQQSGQAANQQKPTPVNPGQVGLVFQHPEDQLFAATVAEDILFGPLNLGLISAGVREKASGTDQSQKLVAEMLAAVGLDASTFGGRSPFTLSGGQMRKVAIAGILAMQPRWLLFDEPTAGLDAVGQAFVHRLIADQLATGAAVLVVSHSIDEFQDRVDRHYQLSDGHLQLYSNDCLKADPERCQQPEGDS
ncbi:MAG: ATP-binding cassette domain-containing protein [Coriobacteriales bacterium]|jgi:energy-coupling factor transport system ATP-binding protein|nr:ATP-binding cassette domain-containing protein [Coriobacteriales bacterium]